MMKKIARLYCDDSLESKIVESGLRNLGFDIHKRYSALKEPCISTDKVFAKGYLAIYEYLGIYPESV